MYCPAWDVKRLLKVSLLLSSTSLVGPEWEILKLAPLEITLESGPIHSTSRIDKLDSHIFLFTTQVSVYPG